MDTKQKIFNAAAELFSVRGYHQVSVREICEACNVTKPVLYYYFRDKEDLLAEMVKEIHRRFEVIILGHISEDQKFQQNLEGFFKGCLEIADYNEPIMNLSGTMQFASLPDGIRELHDQIHKKQMKFLRKIFERGKKEGTIPHNVDLEMMLLSLLGPVGILIMQSIYMKNDPQLKKKLKKYFSFWKENFLNGKIK